MEALDLTKRPPRGPREPLGDLNLLMMARTVDKLRATLPGGSLGPYQLPGFSTRLLEALEISENDLRDAVARARSDEDLVAWIRERTDASKYAACNDALEARTVGDRLGDEKFVGRYPIVTSLDPAMPLIDMLAADDDDMFSKGTHG